MMKRASIARSQEPAESAHRSGAARRDRVDRGPGRARGTIAAGLGGRRGRPGAHCAAAFGRACCAPRSRRRRRSRSPGALPRLKRGTAASRRCLPTERRVGDLLGCIGASSRLLVDEPTSKAMGARRDGRTPRMIVWWGTPVECVSALCRLEREGALSADGWLVGCQAAGRAGCRLARGRNGRHGARHGAAVAASASAARRPMRCSWRPHSRRRKAGRQARRC